MGLDPLEFFEFALILAFRNLLDMLRVCEGLTNLIECIKVLFLGMVDLSLTKHAVKLERVGLECFFIIVWDQVVKDE